MAYTQLSHLPPYTPGLGSLLRFHILEHSLQPHSVYDNCGGCSDQEFLSSQALHSFLLINSGAKVVSQLKQSCLFSTTRELLRLTTVLLRLCPPVVLSSFCLLSHRLLEYPYPHRYLLRNRQ